MKQLKLALSFLTVFPMRISWALQPGDLGRAAAWFPLVGLVIGALLAAAWWGLMHLFPSMLTAALVVALWAALTGGLHLDGLADCSDGLLAAAAPERRLEIMKDPRLGTFGGAGLILHLLIKISAAAAIFVAAGLPTGVVLFGAAGKAATAATPAAAVLATAAAPAAASPILPLLLAPALARWLILLVARQPMARPGGLGADFAMGLTWRTLLYAVLLPLGLVITGGLRALLAAAAAHLAAWGIVRLARARLGGVTGDVLGLTVELSEAVVLLVFAAQ